MAPRGQGGGTTGYGAALAVFVTLWVVTLVVAIFGWVQYSGAEKATVDAQQKQTAAERKLGDMEKNVVKTFSRIVTGDPEKSLSTITAELDQRGLNKNGESLFEVIDGLQRQRDDKAKQADDLIKQVQSAQADREAAQKEITELKPGYDRAVADLKTQVDTIQKQYDELKKFSDDQLQGVNAQLKSMSAAKDKTIADLQNAVAQRDAKIRDLNRQVEDLKRPAIKTAVGVDPSILPKGEVTAVSPDDQVVYINRGWAEHLPLGITFEVYDHDAMIGRDQDGNLRGKATIQVIRVHERSAAARVIREDKGTAIELGDVLGNVAYDPHMVFKFLVFGDFDIDHTGQPQPGDTRRINNMITDWGSKVVDKLDYDTDFLVLGEEPQMPEPLKGEDALDHIKIQQYDAAKAKYLRYESLLGQAASLHIPVLNQNRFLALVGYFQRMPGGTLRHE
jgi:hypothetical protein